MAVAGVVVVAEVVVVEGVAVAVVGEDRRITRPEKTGCTTRLVGR